MSSGEDAEHPRCETDLRTGLCQRKKVDCALACIARGRAVRAVCAALCLSRSNVVAKQNRTLDWVDCKRSPSKTDDAQVRQAIADVVMERATYGYRRVWARLCIDGHRINHKRVYRVMRDESLLLFRQGNKPLDTRKHDGKKAVKESDTRWSQTGWRCLATTVNGFV
jgi:putative transposase